jgi:transcriptional regulator with XRE-family HTH domain
MEKNIIGEFIRFKRKQLRLSQEALAKKANRRRQAIIEIEKNKCETSYSLVEDVLNCLGYELQPVEKGRSVKKPSELHEGKGTCAVIFQFSAE